MNPKSSSSDSLSMDISSPSIVTAPSGNNDLSPTNTNVKRKGNHNESSTTTAKRSKLTDMIFYDGNRHPAAVLHDLRSEISSDNYRFEPVESTAKQTRFQCSLTIDQNGSESIIAVGVGRSKQLAKNMAAQVGHLA
jgi:hypothetical protein